MKRAYVDFDGTIVSVFERYYKVLNDYCSSRYRININYDLYILKKRKRYKDHQIVLEEHPEIQISIDDYHRYKLDNIELECYLAYDSLFPDSIGALSLLKEKGFFVELLTYRNDKNQLEEELLRLDLTSYFDKVTCLKPEQRVNRKSEHIRMTNNHPESIVIGDSPVEIEAAIDNNITGYFVDTGLFSKDVVSTSNVFKTLYDVVKSL
jgi:phosphoglycolate phosphatase-like HAD superfamily hydrolase